MSTKGTDKDKLELHQHAYQWADMLEKHHQAEEQQFFQQLGELAGVTGLMDSSVEQHQLFHHGLEKFQRYLQEIKARSTVFDGQKLQHIIDEFMPISRTHLDDEIDALVALKKYSDKCDWATWFIGKTEKLRQQCFKDARYRVRVSFPVVNKVNMAKTDVFPLIFRLHYSSYGDGAWAPFPPLLWLLQFIVRWMFIGEYVDWWRFAPCDHKSARRDLPFVQEGSLDNN